MSAALQCALVGTFSGILQLQKGGDEAGKRERAQLAHDTERVHVKTVLHSVECCAALSPPGPSTETRIYQIMAEIMRAVTSSTHQHTATLQYSIDIDMLPHFPHCTVCPLF